MEWRLVKNFLNAVIKIVAEITAIYYDFVTGSLLCLVYFFSFKFM